jgi:hypothetical protein
VGLGWALGSQWRLVERYEPILKYMVLATLAGGSSGLSGAGGRNATNRDDRLLTSMPNHKRNIRFTDVGRWATIG